MEFKRPTKDNVELEDFLVHEVMRHNVLVPIIRVEETGIVASGKGASIGENYRNAVIIKRNGDCLVGEDVPQLEPYHLQPSR